MAVQGGYTILIIPLGTALSNLHALRFFLWMKQMQQLERERDALLQGLEMVNQVRDWLQCHLLEAQKRQKHMGAQAVSQDGRPFCLPRLWWVIRHKRGIASRAPIKNT
ncbi:PREDICTED: suppressor APC domain-containing protein 1-like [Thamnophis sirtalis]|uniref:Suppressor APC domain-containing protein 1-like n=1 Tax=Thamnophis sirtalis TaxID=35019 RepID=A0A6I9X489_9SAUR|nr:PREDICTED: suppressor APC domain-containing protein 1-like [Thamnophis sirtalis]